MTKSPIKRAAKEVTLARTEAGEPRAASPAIGKPIADIDDFGESSPEEKAFLDGLDKHRDDFSATAVEWRAKLPLKRS